MNASIPALTTTSPRLRSSLRPSQRLGLALAAFLALWPAAASATPGGFFGAYVDSGGSDARGALISAVVSGSPAGIAGLREGDRVVACDGHDVADAAALVDLLVRASPGDTLRLKVERRPASPDERVRPRQVEVTLGTWGAHRRAQGETTLGAPGRSILIAGRSFPIDAPVVTWRDPGGYDGYFERCHFTPARAAPARPAAGCEGTKRYASRRDLSPALAEVVKAQGWTPSLAAVQIDQVVVHYDVAWTSRNCFKVLHDFRGLSCQFLLDVDGTLYQTLDVVERARHAGAANCRSIGIEIAHPGPLELTRDLATRYATDAEGRPTFDLGRLAGSVRTKGFVVHPARPRPVRGAVQGRVYTQYDFTNEQYATLIRLLAGLKRTLPRIRLEVPRDAEGRVRDAVLTPEELRAFSGILGHYHVSGHKQDPGPAFDWERVLRGARRLTDAPR